LIAEFNVEHRPKMRVMLNELIEKHNNDIIMNSLCVNCGDCSDDNYTTYLFWNKYTFCGEWCQYDGITDMRKNYKNSFRRLNK
jgi:hypothetical protein